MLTDEQRFEAMRAVGDDHSTRLFLDLHSRVGALEKERQNRALILSIAIGVGPIAVGIAALFIR